MHQPSDSPRRFGHQPVPRPPNFITELRIVQPALNSPTTKPRLLCRRRVTHATSQRRNQDIMPPLLSRILCHRVPHSPWPWSASNAARIIRFTTADSFGHAATTRASSGSVSATVINRLQPFSGVLIATIGATKPTIPAFSRGKHRSTEPKGVIPSVMSAAPSF